MSLTTDPTDPRIKRGGPDTTPVPQHEVYLVLSAEERAKGFVRPVRRTYIHVGPPGPTYPLRDLTPDEAHFAESGYIKFEPYPPDGSSKTGRLWTQQQLDAVGKGCGSATTMGQLLAETYARSPGFYGATYCCHCQMHRPVNEFVWEDGSRVGS